MAKLKNARRERFCQEYIKDLNGKQAALRAGYKESTASVQASQLLKILNVGQRVAELQEKIAVKLDISAERVLREISLMAFANTEDYIVRTADGLLEIDMSKTTRDHLAAVQELTVDQTGGDGDGERRAVERVRFKLADKTKNLELLARHLKLLTDKVELSVDESITERLVRGRNRTLIGVGE